MTSYFLLFQSKNVKVKVQVSGSSCVQLNSVLVMVLVCYLCFTKSEVVFDVSASCCLYVESFVLNLSKINGSHLLIFA